MTSDEKAGITAKAVADITAILRAVQEKSGFDVADVTDILNRVKRHWLRGTGDIRDQV